MMTKKAGYGAKTMKAKSGSKMSKKKSSLGMKSVKAGVDKNKKITRADIIVAAKKKAKSGTKVSKKAKTGKSVKKCKYGCK